jgi:sugar fermentation stimulation protein A
VTARGAKHLDELAAMVEAGARAVMMFLVQRDDAAELALAGDIDPHYVERFNAARAAGVETLVYRCRLSEHEIAVDRRLPLVS